MRKYSCWLFITVAVQFWSAVLIGQECRINVSVPDLPNQKVILAHRFGLKFYTDDTVTTDNFGNALIRKGFRMADGMYQLVFPDKKYAEFFLDKNQVFSMGTRISDPTENLTFTGSPENARFLQWQKEYTLHRKQADAIQSRFKKGNLSADSTQLLNKELQKLYQKNELSWNTAIQDLDGTLAGTFIRGMKPVNVPDSLLRLKTKDAQLKQYQFYRTHFFDYVDFTDERLLRTPLIETKLDQYFKQVVPPIADTIIHDARQIIDKARPTQQSFQFIVQYLFNLYSDPQIMGTDAVYVYLAENFYLAGQTPWVDSANLQGIRYRVSEMKPLLLGKTAPAMDGLMDTLDQPVSMENMHSKYLILFFWSPDCSFCKEAAPKLNNLYPELQQLGADILAINTRMDKAIWVQFIKEHQLNWTHAYAPRNTKDIIQVYQAFSTPVIYILDAERHIIAKSISVDQVKPFLIQYNSKK